MENTTSTSHQPYHDSPTSSRSSSPTRHTSTPSTSSSHSSSATIKPLPSLPPQAPAYEPYRDDPATTYRHDPATPTEAPHDQPLSRQAYTDNTPLLTPSASDENIPLAYLLSNPYPHEAPPSYSVAVRQTLSYRDTLIGYIPSINIPEATSQPHRSSSSAFASRRPVVIQLDQESGEVVSRNNDVRHGVEKVVAMFVVAGMLLCLSGVLGWLAFGW